MGLRPGRLPYMQISESLRRWKGRREGWTSGLEYASISQGRSWFVQSLKILQRLSIALKSRDVPFAHGDRVIIANLEWLRLIRRHCEFHVRTAPTRSFAFPATAHICTYLAACIEDRLT